MKVLFDAYWLQSGPPSGRMVVTELIRQWAQSFPDDELTIVTTPCHAAAPLPQGVAVIETRLRPHALAVASLGSLAKKIGADTIITQNFAVRGKNSCVFMHDALFQSNPEFFTLAERSYFALMSLSIHKADLVFTSSETEAARILKHNPKLGKVHALGLSVGSELLTQESSAPLGTRDLRGFVLAVGRLNVRKNLASVFAAAKQSSDISPDLPLLVVGERDGKNQDLLPEIQEMVGERKIVFVGGVSNAELKWLYENASALIFASLDEGFGLPPLEAHQFGCPVLLSDIPVFRELYSSFGAFFNPRDPKDIAETLHGVLGSGRLPESASPVSQKFTWQGFVESLRATVLVKEIQSAAKDI